MNESHYQNLFNSEPEFKCPVCGEQLHTDWVDNGFGAYSIQVSPYVCEPCNWTEKGCFECIYEKCFSWERCKGRALISNGQEEKTHESIDEQSSRTKEAGIE